jgi:hypothetical protein
MTSLTRFPSPPVFHRGPLKLAVAWLLCAGGAAPAQHLAVGATPAGFSFRLATAEASDSWLLRHAPDLKTWRDLAFFPAPGSGETAATLAIARSGLPPGSHQRGFFKAVHLTPEAAAARRPLVEHQQLWRSAAPPRYRFHIRQNSGMISWRATVTVNQGNIEEAVFTDVFPPMFEPTPSTVEDLFHRIGRALDEGAETVSITWDRTLGYPAQGFIDIELQIADEEVSWTIDWLVALDGNS